MIAIRIQDQLATRIEAIERKHARIRHEGPGTEFVGTRKEQRVFPISNVKFEIPRGVLSTGLDEIDRTLGGGLRPGLHEWYGSKGRAGRPVGPDENSPAFQRWVFETQKPQVPKGRLNSSIVPTGLNRSDTDNPAINRWAISDASLRDAGARRLRSGFGDDVPLCLLTHLAWRALEAHPARRVIWVGKNCFPYPAVLVRDGGRDQRLLQRSLFVKAQSPADRVWAADLAIRCGLAGSVIADGTSLDMAATRRLQLAAKARGAFVFLARPPQDLDRLSAASTRWFVHPSVPSCRSLPAVAGAFVPSPQWTLELLRCKGVQPSTSRPVWLVEWDRAANVIRVPAPVCDCAKNQARRESG